MTAARFGVSIQARNAVEAIAQIQEAEAAGVEAAWGTIGAAGGDDVLTTFAAALVQSERILLGTCIVQTWPRHPTVIAQETLALESLAPGRFRLGIGPAHITNMEHAFGIEFRAPLTNLREYLTIVRTLLREGRVDFDGRHVTAHTSVTHTAEVPVFASALRPKSFEACGELADGAISWMCPRSYLVEQALPAIARGAERAGRAAPPLIMHVPVAVDEDRDRVRTMARDQLGLYGSIPFYQAMFEQAGHADPDKGYSDSLLDDLVVSGSEEQVASGLRALIDAGMGEVIATPILNREDRAGSRARTFAAIALASAG